MIAAFEGWNDAGEAASAVIEHLAEIWDAEVVAALDPEEYYDFQVNRPRVLLENGRRRISWRTTRVLGRDEHLARPRRRAGAGRRAVVPVARVRHRAAWSWPRPPTSTMVVTLGALMADVAALAPDPGVRHLRQRGHPAPPRPRDEHATRGPPASSACSRMPRPRCGVPSVSLLGGCAALRGPQPRRPRRRSPSSAGSRTSSTARSSTASSTRTPHAWEHGIDELAAIGHRGRRVRREPRGGPGHRRPARRRAATPSPRSSSATCAAAARTSRSAGQGRRPRRPRQGPVAQAVRPSERDVRPHTHEVHENRCDCRAFVDLVCLR